MIFATFFATLCPMTFAQKQNPLPQPAPLPVAIEAPKDISYPGVIRLDVDASDVLRRIYQIHESVPVAGAGEYTFLFPEWTPGDHAPNEPLEKLAGLVVSANGTRLHWLRDTVNVHAFHVAVPARTTTLDLQYQYLGSTGGATGPVLITPKMLDLQWQTLILYPAGYFIRDIRYKPSIILPEGWTYLSSMDAGVKDGNSTANTIRFPSVPLDALIDQPVMAGQYLRQVVLSTDPVPVRLDVAAQSADDFTALNAAAQNFAALMPQTYKLFGSHHYDHYDHMLFLSDEMSSYFEHHRSGENVAPANYLRSAENVPDLGFIVHGYVHSWNGMFRRPAEMWTPNLNTPERDSMLWVFEGLTEYWTKVLCFRSGIYKTNTIQDLFAPLAAAMTLDVGSDWRPLEDTNNDPIIIARNAESWPSWQRTMIDPYTSGEMIWLEADIVIRQQSKGAKSLDDFARTFFGGDNDAGNVTSTYSFDAMVDALNDVQPYDWRGFFRSRLDQYGGGHLAHIIDLSGYKLVFTDQPTGTASSSKSLDLAYSVGMRVGATGVISAVRWGGPAFQAKLTVGETINSVNGKPYSPAILTDAIMQAAKGAPLNLVVTRGAWRQEAAINWTGGMRFPHLERDEGRSALLDEILVPL